MALFIATFTTLLAIINPFEAPPVYLGFAEHMDDQSRHSLAIRSCLYALALMFFFLIFGTLLLKVFGVPLAMVRIAGGIILTRLGFQLFSSPSSVGGSPAPSGDKAATPTTTRPSCPWPCRSCSDQEPWRRFWA